MRDGYYIFQIPSRIVFFARQDMIMRPLICLLTLTVVFGCAGAGLPTGAQKDEHARIIKGVPFYPQEDYQCGPASLAAVLNFWGVPVSPDDVAKEIYSQSARGTLGIDMVFYAQSKGLEASSYSGGLEDLRRKIDANQPAIVLVDEGFSLFREDHFMVVIGYNEEGFIVNSGKKEGVFVSSKDFLKTWEKARFWTLHIGKVASDK